MAERDVDAGLRVERRAQLALGLERELAQANHRPVPTLAQRVQRHHHELVQAASGRLPTVALILLQLLKELALAVLGPLFPSHIHVIVAFWNGFSALG